MIITVENNAGEDQAVQKVNSDLVSTLNILKKICTNLPWICPTIVQSLIMFEIVNSVAKEEINDLSELKALADDNGDVFQTLKFVLNLKKKYRGK